MSRRSVIRCCWIIWPKGGFLPALLQGSVWRCITARGANGISGSGSGTGRAAWRYATLISRVRPPQRISPMSGIQRIKMRDRRYWCSRASWITFLTLRSNRDSRCRTAWCSIRSATCTGRWTCWKVTGMSAVSWTTMVRGGKRRRRSGGGAGA